MTTASSLRRFGTILPGGRSVTLSALDPAARSGRTMFGNRVVTADTPARLFKRGHHSRKIGDVVQKGRWRGLPIFTLTLEERATCPRTCKIWHGCYGNGMNWAERIVAGPELEARLPLELAALAKANPRGFVVRLHVLGDFYSVDYVRLWTLALERLPGLRVFGFTARDPVSDAIGVAIKALVDRDWDRFAIRFSGAGLAAKGAEISGFTAATPPDSSELICPAQLGLTDCCATCGLCWTTPRTISFLRH